MKYRSRQFWVFIGFKLLERQIVFGSGFNAYQSRLSALQLQTGIANANSWPVMQCAWPIGMLIECSQFIVANISISKAPFCSKITHDYGKPFSFFSCVPLRYISCAMDENERLIIREKNLVDIKVITLRGCLRCRPGELGAKLIVQANKQYDNRYLKNIVHLAHQASMEHW